MGFNAQPERRIINLSDLTLTNECLPRANGINDDVVHKYALLIGQGIKLPALRAYWDEAKYWLWDGYHTYHALKTLGITKYPCEITNGDFAKAVRAACSSRRFLGITREDGDLSRQIDTMLRDPVYGKMGIRHLADHIGCSHTAIQKRRNYWRNRQQDIEITRHWSLFGTEKQHQEVLEINREILPTTNFQQPIVQEDGSLNKQRIRRRLNRDAAANCKAASRNCNRVLTDLKKLSKLRPSYNLNRTVGRILKIQELLAVVVKDCDELTIGL